PRLLGRPPRPGLERARRAHLLAQRVVRDPDDRGLGDTRMLVQRLLALPRVHVEPAADDQVLLPVDDVEVAVVVLPAHVAGPEPAVRYRRGGRLWLAPVAPHH